jgi:hypothetical protein
MDNRPLAVAPTPETSNTRRPAAPQHRLWWLRLLAGPIIYAIFFTLAYLAVEAACHTELLRFTVAGTNGITVAVLALTAAAFVAVLVSLLWNIWRLRRTPKRHDPEFGDTDRFIDEVGIMLNLLFALLVLATGMPALLIAPCAWS